MLSDILTTRVVGLPGHQSHAMRFVMILVIQPFFSFSRKKSEKCIRLELRIINICHFAEIVLFVVLFNDLLVLLGKKH